MYKIRLPNFEGPFDLLLYFIKRDEINIYDIPIARITAEFLRYIRVIQTFDLELAGEFIVMASTLMYIKTQMLLPRTKEDGTSEVEDPRTQLVQRILEYKQFKEAAGDLQKLSDEQRYTYYRQIFEAEQSMAGGDAYKNASLFDLINAFRKVIERNTVVEELQHVVNLQPVTVDEKKELILNSLKTRRKITFFEITLNKAKAHLVCTFLAILDLVRRRDIFILQADNFDDIVMAAKPFNS